MEVHHHPDLHHKEKKFKEYFLEFLMIFLAVTLGFIAENVREHFTDRGKAKKYVQTLYYDLKDDTTALNNNIPFWQDQIKRIDTLRSELKKGARMKSILANRLATTVRYYGNFEYHDRTIAQLKSSGNFRLLNDALADSIMEYDTRITSTLRDQEAHGQKIYIDVNNLQDKIFESGLLEMYLNKGVSYTDSLLAANPGSYKIHTDNKEVLFEYYNALEFWQLGIYWRLRSYEILKQKATNLIKLIKKDIIFNKSTHDCKNKR